MRVAVLSGPGREARTWATLEQLAKQNPGVPFNVFRSSGRDPIGDFWALLELGRLAGGDLLALEDDIVTARNFLRYAARWRSPFVTSFFHPRRGVELGQPARADGHAFNQAIKIPRAMLELLLQRPPARRPGSAQDDALGEALASRGLPIVYHRSLVQHLGAVSTIWGDKTTLEGRTAVDFPGLEFDCLSIESS